MLFSSTSLSSFDFPTSHSSSLISSPNAESSFGSTGTSRMSGMPSSRGSFASSLKHSSPKNPHPSRWCKSLLAPNGALESLMCSALRYWNPILESNSSQNLVHASSSRRSFSQRTRSSRKHSKDCCALAGSGLAMLMKYEPCGSTSVRGLKPCSLQYSTNLDASSSLNIGDTHRFGFLRNRANELQPTFMALVTELKMPPPMPTCAPNLCLKPVSRINLKDI
ncbi:hypothetical protein OGATHE_003034 [Ogataea polymorpha]|uniref:Uncharacterized protein n=1 Tax=Ogataea polymorpha TaxID=460523 RepID=A0A9P8T9P5_9ASCO|nr:hypothetical protein OGATHE_003034 [Ogataea polymorpha]